MQQRTTEIVVEMDELIVVAHGAGGRRGWCGACGVAVDLLTPAVAATTARLSERAVHHLVEAGALHFAETAAGHLLICLASLGAYCRAALPPGIEGFDSQSGGES